MDGKQKVQSIKRLNITDETVNILENNDIHTLEALCEKTKTNLKQLGIKYSQISKIEIELQLLGLNLRNSL